MEPVTIFLTPIDVELFKKFQQYHEVFLLLEKHEVFDIQYGHAKLNFAGGVIKNVEVSNVYIA